VGANYRLSELGLGEDMSIYKRTHDQKRRLETVATRCEDLAHELRRYANHEANYEHEYLEALRRAKGYVLESLHDLIGLLRQELSL
jgi:hypothetical protein